MAGPDFLESCAFVCVDLQDGGRGGDVTDEALPPAWKAMGFVAADVNAATAHAWEVGLPNAVRAAEASRRLGMPMVFIHWGYRFRDGMDLDPEIYRSMRENHGLDPAGWHGYIGAPDSRPASALKVREVDYVIAKSGQDAFTSSNLGFVLVNLGVRRLVFVGGHTEACLGKTARSARDLGYRTLCIEDATNNARESTRLRGIEEAGFEHVVSTAEYCALVESRAGAALA